MTDETSAEGTQSQAAPVERKFSQAEMNELAGKIRAEERERMTRAQQQQTHQSQMAPAPAFDPKLIDDAVSKKLEEARQQYAREQAEIQGQQFAVDFDKKLAAAKDNYADFDETVKPFINDLAGNHHLLKMIHAADNTGDIVYDLAKNPHKFAQMSHLATYTQPNGLPGHSALKAMHDLSTSIKQNKAAQQIPQANEPLGQVKPSVTGTDSGKKTTTDIRKQDYLRV